MTVFKPALPASADLGRFYVHATVFSVYSYYFYFSINRCSGKKGSKMEKTFKRRLKMRSRTHSLCIICAVVMIPIFLGCGSNISHIQPTGPVEKTKIYNAPLEKVWSTVQRILSEDNTFKVLDKSSGIMVTEFRTIDAQELSLIQTSFLGKTYKYNYTINFMGGGSGRTEVNVNVKLQANQIALLSREERNEDVENYLRKQLFDKVSAKL